MNISAQCLTLASDNSAVLQLLRFQVFTSMEPLDSAIQLPKWILLIFNWWWWGWLSVYFHLHFCSASLHLNISCTIRVFWKQQSSVEMLSVYLSSFLFQRGSDELFSTCVTNGPFIMSSNASSAGNIAYKKRTAIGYCRYCQEVWFFVGFFFIFNFKICIFDTYYVFVRWCWTINLCPAPWWLADWKNLFQDICSDDFTVTR